MTIESRHTLSYCKLCEHDIVLCADCGNNCCNAGTGKLPNGERCGCKEAYEHQHMHLEDPTSIHFAKDIREEDKSKPLPGGILFLRGDTEGPKLN